MIDLVLHAAFTVVIIQTIAWAVNTIRDEIQNAVNNLLKDRYNPHLMAGTLLTHFSSRKDKEGVMLAEAILRHLREKNDNK